MKPDKREIEILTGRLNIDADQAGQIADEIDAGDDLLEKLADLPIPPEVFEKTTRLIQKRLYRRRWLGNITKIAAALIMALAAVSLLLNLTGRQNRSPGPETPMAAEQNIETFAGELDIWELLLTEEDYYDQQIDDLTITEVLILWDDLEWNSNNILGKENDHENEKKNVSLFTVGGRAGVRRV